jgi:hypothetical protein
MTEEVLAIYVSLASELFDADAGAFDTLRRQAHFFCAAA